MDKIYNNKDSNLAKDSFLNSEINKFKQLKDKGNFTDRFYHYEGILKGWMIILAMIYFCLLLIAVTFAAVSLMFYACLKRQGYLITFMHILWNIIRFFMVSFFIFGAAYGIFDLALTDSISVIKYLFSPTYIGDTKLTNKKIPADSTFLKNCFTITDHNYYEDIDFFKNANLKDALVDFYIHYKELMKLMEEENTINYFSCIKTDDKKKTICDELKWVDPDIIKNRKGDFYESFNCGFLHNDFNILYKALYDAATESEYLAAISLCASFFGAVAVYFYLLVLHHYNNEMFFDSGKSIFKGFDGYGGGFKKKNIQQDPAYKKRKLRAEIELTSKNDEASGYNKDINKNEEED